MKAARHLNIKIIISILLCYLGKGSNMLKKRLYKLSFVRNMNIQTKIILSFSILIIAAISVIGLVSVSKYSRSMENDTGMYSLQIIDQVIKNVDFYVREMEDISTISNYNYYIQKYLKSGNMNSGTERLHDANRIVDLLQSIGSIREDIVSIIIIGNDGSILSSNINDKINKSYNFLRQKWYKDAIEARGKSVIVKPQKQSYLADSSNLVISLSRSINSFDGSDQLGVILIDLNLKVLDDICRNVRPGKQGYVFIVDKEGNYIFHPDYSYMYRSMDDMYIRNAFKSDDNIVPDVLRLNEGSFIKKINSEKDQITYKRIDSTGWTVVSITPYNEMVSEITNIRSFIIIIGLVCLFIAFALSVFISSMISRPVKKLELLMEEAEKGNLDISLDLESSDEIGLLSQRFNNLIVKIKSLMKEVIKEQEDKRKSEFKALQAQINPHFLYNTLDSIMWMAEENKEGVVVMIEALATLLRISLSKGNEIITIENELEHIKNYLIIQSMRYTNKFDYEIDVDENILQKSSLKLILQPLVENSIYHGIKNKRQKGLIKIKGKIVEGKILLEIIDDGIGMSKLECKEILISKPPKQGLKDLNGVGVKNVNDRIQLYYGEEYGLKYISQPGIGTTVQIWLPLI